MDHIKIENEKLENELRVNQELKNLKYCICGGIIMIITTFSIAIYNLNKYV